MFFFNKKLEVLQDSKTLKSYIKCSSYRTRSSHLTAATSTTTKTTYRSFSERRLVIRQKWSLSMPKIACALNTIISYKQIRHTLYVFSFFFVSTYVYLSLFTSLSLFCHVTLLFNSTHVYL